MSTSTGSVTLVADSRCTLGEGIVWCERLGAVLWTDIEGARLWMHTHAENVTRSWSVPERLGSFALCESGALLLGLAKGLAIARLDIDGDGELPVTRLVDVEPGAPTRVNDGRADRHGNFVFGTMSEDYTSRIGSFYQYSSAHGLRRLDLDDVAIANSICFSPDGKTMYFCDTQQRRIMQCDYDGGGARVSRVREFFDLSAHPGFPDGSTIDAEGCLWNAEWGAALVRRYTPGGRVDRHVAVPVKNPSCVAFGGPDLDELYVTTARQMMTPQELAAMPQAGGVYRSSPGESSTQGRPLRGLCESRFRDR